MMLKLKKKKLGQNKEKIQGKMSAVISYSIQNLCNKTLTLRKLLWERDLRRITKTLELTHTQWPVSQR